MPGCKDRRPDGAQGRYHSVEAFAGEWSGLQRPRAPGASERGVEPGDARLRRRLPAPKITLL